MNLLLCLLQGVLPLVGFVLNDFPNSSKRDCFISKHRCTLDTMHFVQATHHTGYGRACYAFFEMKKGVLEISLCQSVAFVNWSICSAHTVCNAFAARSICDKVSVTGTSALRITHASLFDHLQFVHSEGQQTLPQNPFFRARVHKPKRVYKL